MSTTADYFVPFVVVEAAQCPDMVARHAVTAALQAFYSESGLWRHECDAVSTINESEIELDIPSGTSVRKVITLAAGTLRVGATTPEEAGRHRADWMTATGNTLLGHWLTGPNTLRLYPILSTQTAISAYCALAPLLTCQTFPDSAMQFEQGIIHGAIGKLQSMVGQPFFNPSGATYHMNEFGRAVGAAKIRANNAGGAPLQVRLP